MGPAHLVPGQRQLVAQLDEAHDAIIAAPLEIIIAAPHIGAAKPDLLRGEKPARGDLAIGGEAQAQPAGQAAKPVEPRRPLGEHAVAVASREKGIALAARAKKVEPLRDARAPVEAGARDLLITGQADGEAGGAVALDQIVEDRLIHLHIGCLRIDPDAARGAALQGEAAEGGEMETIADQVQI